MRGIVVDGVGCSGKSDLIATLKTELKVVGGYDVRELDHSDCEDQFTRYLREYATGATVLFHRSHLSEMVFGQIQRNRPPFSDAEIAALNTVLSLRFVSVLAEPPNYETFVRRAAERGTLRVYSKREYMDVIEAFRRAFRGIPHEQYVSTSRTDLAATRNRILSTLGVKRTVLDL
jgi:hypothetical protein